MEPIKAVENRREDGTFGAGNNANPHGRPKGQTLKEFAREQLLNMPPEEKVAFLKQLPVEIRWKMAEGNPHQTQETEITLPESLLAIIRLNGTTDTKGGPDVSSEG